MKFNDDITLSIAATVQDVLEGKPAVKKEEVKYPHMMYDPKTGKSVEVKDKSEHDKYSKMGWGHDKPKNVSEVEEPNVPSKDANMGSKQGEAEFKKLHKGKKVGEKEDGKVVKEFTITLDEAKIDVDYIGDNDLSKKLEKKFKVKIKDTGQTTADISGTKANLIKFLKSDAYLMDNDEIEELFPELMEETLTEAYNKKKELARINKIDKLAEQIGKEIRKFPDEITDEETDDKDLANAYYDMNKGLGDLEYGIGDYAYALRNLDESVKEGKEVDEESEKQAAYKKVFNMALKKFGVKGIGELDAEKKKEFFNYVDKNYEAKAEELDKKSDDDVDEITGKQSKKLPPALVKAIKAKEKEEVKEGKLSVKAFMGSDAGGPSYKNFGLKLKKLGSSSFGGNDVEISGPDNSLLKFAKAALGVSKAKNVKDAQKEIDDQM